MLTIYSGSLLCVFLKVITCLKIAIQCCYIFKFGLRCLRSKKMNNKYSVTKL